MVDEDGNWIMEASCHTATSSWIAWMEAERVKKALEPAEDFKFEDEDEHQPTLDEIRAQHMMN